ncbi:MAG: tRNA 2-thiouridine(34) synthase MnmA [Thermoleophilia bacterium]|nr:tRNA 2-thiouridine(34) synthase MnmA [Thermoleophilia bacterium]
MRGEAVGHAAANGDLAWVELTVAGERIVAARGEGPGAAGLVRRIRGLTPLEAAAVPARGLSGDALHDALASVASARASTGRTAVAMSGGVDSAVALLRVRETGAEAVGITLRLWADPEGPTGERACCSPAAVVAARETCHSLGVPHFTLDLREPFRAAVVRPFVEGYAGGTTPNPCVRCNGDFRFSALLAFARRVGAAALATGHYARVVEHRGRTLLARGADREKDQSYMLATVDPDLLPSLRFPLGEQTKAETRAQAQAAGLAAAGRAESQEACFLAGGDYRSFLARQGVAAQPGAIVDEDGRAVGRHDGFWKFTPGQRRGLAVAAGVPVYALATDARTNTVLAGPRSSLARRSVRLAGARLHAPVERADVKLRHRAATLRAHVHVLADSVRLDLEEPAYAVAPGQVAVLYEQDVVVGAGTIEAAE